MWIFFSTASGGATTASESLGLLIYGIDLFNSPFLSRILFKYFVLPNQSDRWFKAPYFKFSVPAKNTPNRSETLNIFLQFILVFGIF